MNLIRIKLNKHGMAVVKYPIIDVRNNSQMSLVQRSLNKKAVILQKMFTWKNIFY